MGNIYLMPGTEEYDNKSNCHFRRYRLVVSLVVGDFQCDLLCNNDNVKKSFN